MDDVEESIFGRVGIVPPDNAEAWPPPNRYRVVSPSGSHFIEKTGLPTMGLRNTVFNRRLLALAERAGAEFRAAPWSRGPCWTTGETKKTGCAE